MATTANLVNSTGSFTSSMALTLLSYGSHLFASNIILPIRIMFEAMWSMGTNLHGSVSTPEDSGGGVGRLDACNNSTNGKEIHSLRS